MRTSHTVKEIKGIVRVIVFVLLLLLSLLVCCRMMMITAVCGLVGKGCSGRFPDGNANHTDRHTLSLSHTKKTTENEEKPTKSSIGMPRAVPPPIFLILVVVALLFLLFPPAFSLFILFRLCLCFLIAITQSLHC